MSLPSSHPETANDRFKRGFSQTFWLSLSAAVVAHALVFAFWPTMTTADVAISAAELETIELPRDLKIPPPPAPLSRPATPIVATTEIADDITIEATTFENFKPSDLPPPPQSTRADRELSDAPVMVPHTIKPDLKNRAQVEQALVRSYPPMLKDAGIGGVATVWFFIDEDGRVQRRLLNRKSGYDALDQAALEVAEVMRFSPAMNRDRRVPVWVEIPIIFTAK